MTTNLPNCTPCPNWVPRPQGPLGILRYMILCIGYSLLGSIVFHIAVPWAEDLLKQRWGDEERTHDCSADSLINNIITLAKAVAILAENSEKRATVAERRLETVQKELDEARDKISKEYCANNLVAKIPEVQAAVKNAFDPWEHAGGGQQNRPSFGKLLSEIQEIIKREK